jgi:glycosyltransferase involved in cell wall biosynthesis
MEPLNVCLVNDSFPPAIDGVANAVVNYGNVITAHQGRATVVTPYYPQADDSGFPFPVVRYPSVDMTKIIGYRAGVPFHNEILRQLEETGFDIIHSHCPVMSTLLARALRERIHVPLVFTYHTKFDIDIANAVRSKMLRESLTKFLIQNVAACDEVWVVSNGAGENLRKLGYEGSYSVMPNGVDLPRGRVADDLIRETTADFDLPAGVPVFLFVGRMMWYKGLRIILDALKQLAWSNKQLRVLLEQMSHTHGFPEIAGGYSTTRHITNAIRKVINTKEDQRETLLTYARTINEEIRIKRREFNLPVD